jgi:integrase
LAMRWDEIDWHQKTWRIPETKNGEPITIPLINPAVEVLEIRKQATNSVWVFESEKTNGHLADPKKTWDRVRQRATLELWRQTPSHTTLIEEVDAKLREASNYYFTISKLFKAIVKEAEEREIALPTGLIDIRLHDIRRTLGSYQAMTGASLPIIGKTLGHKNQATTQIYARLNTDPVRESINKAADEMFKFGEGKL